jgi:UDP-sugar diphosphatase
LQDRVKVLEIKELKTPKTTKVYEIKYKQDDKTQTKEVVKAKDVVKILVYNKDKDAFIITKQFRPHVYINHPNLAFRYELCGGRMDKGISVEQTAKEEVLEELGYDVKKLKKVTTLTTYGKMHLFYAEVSNSDKVSGGGGVDYEMIDEVTVPIKRAKEFMFDENIPKRPGLMFMFCWYFNMK